MSEIISIIDSILYSHGKSPELWPKLSKKFQATSLENIVFIFNEMKNKITTLNTESILLSMDIFDYCIDTGNSLLRKVVTSENSLKFFSHFLQSNIDKKLKDKVLYLIKKWTIKYGKEIPNLSSFYVSLKKQGFSYPEVYEDTYLKYLQRKTPPVTNKNLENTSKGNENLNSSKKIKYTPIDPKNYLNVINLDLNTTSYEKIYSRLVNKLYDFTHAIQESNILINKNSLGKDSEKIDRLCKELLYGKKQLIETIKSDRLKNEKLMDITLKVIDDIETTIQRREKQKTKKILYPFFTSFYQVKLQSDDKNNGYKKYYSTNMDNINLNLGHLHSEESVFNSLIDEEKEQNHNVNLPKITKSDNFTDKIDKSDKFNDFINKVEREQKIWTNDGGMITNDGKNYFDNNNMSSKNKINDINNNINSKDMKNLNNNNNVNEVNNVVNNMNMDQYINQKKSLSVNNISSMNNDMINNINKNNDIITNNNFYNNIYNNTNNNMNNNVSNSMNASIKNNMVFDYIPIADLNDNLNNQININNNLNANMCINNPNTAMNYIDPNIKIDNNNIQNYNMNNINSNPNMSMNYINPDPNMNMNYINPNPNINLNYLNQDPNMNMNYIDPDPNMNMNYINQEQNMNINYINPEQNTNINYFNQNNINMNNINQNNMNISNINNNMIKSTIVQNGLQKSDPKLNNSNSYYNDFSNFSSVSYSVSEAPAPFLDELNK